MPSCFGHTILVLKLHLNTGHSIIWYSAESEFQASGIQIVFVICFLQGARIVKQLDQSMLVSYQMTTSNGGFIFPRDFVLAVKFGESEY